VFGGGWLDHAIYFVDLLRWLGSDEVAEVRGRVANLRHASESLEDYGDAALRFVSGGVAHVECGWTVATGPELLRELHFVGASGQAVWTTRGSLGVGTLDATRRPSGEIGWVAQDLSVSPVVTLVEHAMAVMRGEVDAVASIHDARANLEVCLAFYERAERL
jgi:predicted dehydrogenase